MRVYVESLLGAVSVSDAVRKTCTVKSIFPTGSLPVSDHNLFTSHLTQMSSEYKPNTVNSVNTTNTATPATTQGMSARENGYYANSSGPGAPATAVDRTADARYRCNVA